MGRGQGGGRPTKYKEEYCEMLTAHMAEGFSYSSFAAVINVNDDSLREWEKRHPRFSVAKKEGRKKQEFFYEKLFKKGALGGIPNFNSTAAIWLSKNMIGWRDKIETEVTQRNIQVFVQEEDIDL